MFAPVALALALAAPAAPVPKPAPPAGPPPYLLHLKADDNGQVKLRLVRTEPQKVVSAMIVPGPNGQQVVQQVEREVTVSKVVMAGVEDLKDLKAYTGDGKELTPKVAAEKIGSGAIVVASADGAKIHESYLKLFREDVIILCSPELVPQQGGRLLPPTVRPVIIQPAMPVPAPLPAAPPVAPAPPLVPLPAEAK